MRLLAALLVFVPVSVLSQTPEAQPTPSAPPVSAPVAGTAPSLPEPLWSIGAGVSYFSGLFMSTSTIGLAPGPLLGATASLERRLSRDTWLALGIVGRAERGRRDAPTYVSAATDRDAAQLSIRAGVRRIVTPRTAPVDLSFLVDAVVGYGVDDTTYGGTADVNEQALLVGASVGLAVDRELTPRVAVRVATSIVDAGWEWTRSKTEGAPVVHGSDLWLGVALSPRLELRVAF